MEYRIAEVATKTGFSAPTLRYYEQIGVLPPPGRTAAGQRVYDDRAIERLAFVARAKELGCSLEEITELVAAFDGDECDEVRVQLRDLVESKVVEAKARAAELTAFTAQLESAAAALDRPSDTDSCGDACACTLATAEDVRQRVDDWRAVLSRVRERVPTVDGGLRLELDAAAPVGDVARLAVAEHACCSFFSFAVTVDSRGAALEVRAPEAARQVMLDLFG